MSISLLDNPRKFSFFLISFFSRNVSHFSCFLLFYFSCEVAHAHAYFCSRNNAQVFSKCGKRGVNYMFADDKIVRDVADYMS